MAVQESPGAVASLDAFLDDLMDFAAAHAGFTRLSNTSVNGSTLYRLSRTGDSTMYWGFRQYYYNSSSTASQGYYGRYSIRGRCMLTTPTSSNFWTNVSDTGPASICCMGIYYLTPPFAGYKFFSDGNNVFAVLEIQQGIYAHLAFGNVRKLTPFHGGEYLVATNGARTNATDQYPWYSPGKESINYEGAQWLFSSAVKNFDGGDGSSADGCGSVRIRNTYGDSRDFALMGQTQGLDASGEKVSAKGTVAYSTGTSTAGGCMADTESSTFRIAGRNSPTMRPPLLPIYLTRSNDETEYNTCYIFAAVDSIRTVNMANLEPATVTLGNWQCYPLAQKYGDTYTAPTSSFTGIAYLIDD